MMKELVSVIIPSYNREGTIVRAIRSVLNQTYSEIEVIVVDDCSTDNTKCIVESTFANESRVIYHRLKKNSGACVARNTGVKLSKGKYVAFLDSDDVYIATKIEKQVNFINQTNIPLCATDYSYILKEGDKKYVKTYSGDRDEIYKRLLYCNFITTGTLLGYRSCFVEIPFDEKLPRYQDWDLVLRLCKKYHFCFIKESTLVQYYQAVSITASTNHGKTLDALMIIYNKNLEGYKSCKKAYSQIHWLMGLHSLFVPHKKNLKSLWIGVIGNGLKIRRLFIYIAALLNMKIILNNRF